MTSAAGLRTPKWGWRGRKAGVGTVELLSHYSEGKEAWLPLLGQIYQEPLCGDQIRVKYFPLDEDCAHFIHEGKHVG